MKVNATLWIKRIVIGTALAALPQLHLARVLTAADWPKPRRWPDAQKDPADQ